MIYTGHTTIALIQFGVMLVTCGVGALWPMVDGIMMIMGKVTDSDSHVLREGLGREGARGVSRERLSGSGGPGRGADNALDQSIGRLAPRWLLLRKVHVEGPPVLLRPDGLLCLSREHSSRAVVPSGVAATLGGSSLPSLLGSPDGEAGGRALQAMLKMRKLDVATVQRAHDGV